MDRFVEHAGRREDRRTRRTDSQLAGDDVVVAMGGYGNAWLGVKTGGRGDITDSHRLWRNKQAPQRIGSGVTLGEHIYIVNEPGTAQCIEWKTGKILWTERLTSTTWANLLHADGRLYTTSLDGESVVFAANSEKLEVLARNT